MFERLSKRVTKKSAFFALFLVLALFTLTPQVTHAQVASGIENILWTLVNVLFGWLVWVGGMLLDTSINEYVIGFGDIYATKGLGFTIDGLWVVVRDIFNLTFIFGLVFIGLKMIFGSDSNTKKLLVSLILAALLVNFSLFITKFVVDFSNIAAVQLVNAFPLSAGKPSVSGEFARLMGITGLWNTGSAGGFDASKLVNGGGLGYILGTMMLYIVAAFVFLGGGLLLMIRFVVLNIYIVLSPLMFIGWVFPSAAKYTSEYWSGFLSRCFFAPAYILMLYFAQKILSTFAVTAGGLSLSSMFNSTGPGTFTSVFPPFVLTSVFLIAALVVAQKMGATGASGVMAAGKQLSGRAKVAAYGAAGGAARFTASQTAGRAARSITYGMGNRLSKQVDRFQNSNNRLVRSVARSTGVDSTIRGTANKLQNTKFGLSQTREQQQSASNSINLAADNRSKEQLAANQVLANAVTAASSSVDITARQNARQIHTNEVGQMSNDQILERARQDSAYVMSPQFASLLSDGNVTALKNSGIYDNNQMAQLEQNRTDGALSEIDQVLTNSNASVDNLNSAIDNLNKTVGSMSDQRILGMNSVQRNDPAFAASMSQTQFDSFMSSNASPADKSALRTARTTGQQRVALNGSLVDPASPGAASPGATDPGFQERNRRKMFKNPQQAGLLPTIVLQDPAIAEYLTPRIIEEFLNNNPTPADITAVRLNVEDYITNPGTNPSITATWQNWMLTTVLGRRFL